MLELRLDAEPLKGRTHDMLASESCRSSPDGDLKITQNLGPKELIFRGMCAKSLQLHLTLCDPMDCSLPGSSVHGDSPGKNTGVGCRALLQEIFPT